MTRVPRINTASLGRGAHKHCHSSDKATDERGRLALRRQVATGRRRGGCRKRWSPPTTSHQAPDDNSRHALLPPPPRQAARPRRRPKRMSPLAQCRSPLSLSPERTHSLPVSSGHPSLGIAQAPMLLSELGVAIVGRSARHAAGRGRAGAGTRVLSPRVAARGSDGAEELSRGAMALQRKTQSARLIFGQPQQRGQRCGNCSVA